MVGGKVDPCLHSAFLGNGEQIGLCTPREYLSLLVLARCINKPFFNRCRTQEQLGMQLLWWKT